MAQDVQEVAAMIRGLEGSTGKGKGKNRHAKKSSFDVVGSDIKVDSWKYQEWDYKRDDLPTYARGLFTTRTKRGTPEIVTRGYDKFFNVGEVRDTHWDEIERCTRGPYELSVKENGCIIFMSGLEDGTLLVCSKHSTGARQDVELSHAVAGERWAEKHLASVGKTKEDLAKELRKMNATAVGELCDDSFEEHVLAYNEQSSGIYLHGINFNLPEFATLKGPEVHNFADTWGFKKAQFVMKDNISDVRTFLEACAETGSWNGRDTEGFVIRCQQGRGDQGPYRDWFFKYKFEEPYLMYRQWRECTKAVIGGKIPKYKKHKKITEQYLLYARRQLANDRNLAKAYNQNHGIIAMRDGFLAEMGLKGSDIIRQELAEENGSSDEVRRRVILVPIASIGCGKTTVALALVKLFGWGHVQNDNIQGKGNRPRRFATEITNGMAVHPVMIADRNNHQKRERKQLFDDIYPIVPDAKFVAMQYVHEPKQQLLPSIREITHKRVLERGDNHQTIRAESKSSDEIIGIMEGFLNRFEAVDANSSPDDNYDKIINLDIAASSRDNLEVVITALHNTYSKLFPADMPSPSDLDDAIAWAMDSYSVEATAKHDLSFSKSKNAKSKNQHQNRGLGQSAPLPPPQPLNPDQLISRLEYFSITLPSSAITTILSSLFPPSTPPATSKLYNHLLNSRRIQPSFHVTLIHRASSKTSPSLWSKYTTLYTTAYTQALQSSSTTTSYIDPTSLSLGAARIRLERLIWDDRIMAFVARILPGDEKMGNATHPEPDKQGIENEEVEWGCANEIPHVTVGTASSEVKPKESNDLLRKWLDEGAGGTEGNGVFESEVKGYKVVEGTVKGVLQRGKW
jgi:tRNA ligase